MKSSLVFFDLPRTGAQSFESVNKTRIDVHNESYEPYDDEPRRIRRKCLRAKLRTGLDGVVKTRFLRSITLDALPA